MTTTELTDADIATRIRTGRRCPLCREDRRPGGVLCWEHHDELSRLLDPAYLGERHLERAASIPNLWAALDPAPRRGGDQDRRPPGFHSTPPCNLDAVVMRDRRSRAYEVVEVWFDPLPGGLGDDLSRPHFEDNSPPRSVEKVIASLADAIWDELELDGRSPRRDVEGHCRWLHQHLDHITAREDAEEIFRDLADLHAQLRPVVGDPRPVPVASCTGWVRDRYTGEKVECGAPLYLPPPDPGVAAGLAQPRSVDPRRPVVRCRVCDRPYTALMLLRLEIGAEKEAS